MALRSDVPSVLVTGSGGFTGKHLCRELEVHGYRVFGVSQRATPAPDELVLDLRDTRAVRDALREVRPTFVVHLAAIAFVAHDTPLDLYDVNVLGTLSLLEALEAEGSRPSRVLLASSANVYGSPTVEQVDETLFPAPIGHYAASKLVMEHLSRSHADRLPIVITRPFNYTGPGQEERYLVPKLVAHFRDRRDTIELGNLDVERDFSDVRDVARIYRLLLESPQAVGVTVNVASGRGIALRDMLARLSEMTRHEIEVQVNPAFVRKNEIARLVGDTTRLTALVGAVERTPFDATLRDMLSA